LKNGLRIGCQQEEKDGGNLDLNQGPTGYEGADLLHQPLRTTRFQKRIDDFN